MSRLSVRFIYENTRGEIEVTRDTHVNTEHDIRRAVDALQATLLAAVKKQNS